MTIAGAKLHAPRWMVQHLVEFLWCWEPLPKNRISRLPSSDVSVVDDDWAPAAGREEARRIAIHIAKQLAGRRVYADRNRPMLISLSKEDARWLGGILPRGPAFRVGAEGERAAIALDCIRMLAKIEGLQRRGPRRVWSQEMNARIERDWAMSYGTKRRYVRTLKADADDDAENPEMMDVQHSD